ncbi:glycosyl transferase [Vibrio breoganii]
MLIKSIVNKIKKKLIPEKEDNISSIFQLVKLKIIDKALNGLESLIDEDSDIIVSLTTYSYRIHDVGLVIESIGLQSVKPKKIILWLDKTEFTINSLPNILYRQIDRGLEVRFCDNIKSYKKLIPTLELYPNDNIITIDDDYIYPYDLIETLVKTSILHPNKVVSNFAHKIKFDKNGTPLRYKQWDLYTGDSSPSKDIFPVGAGGVLYPSGCFNIDVTNRYLFTDLAPNADDVWFKYMTLSNGVVCVKTDRKSNYRDDFISIDGNQDMGLFNSNLNNDGNDYQIMAVSKYINKTKNK